MGSEGKLLKMIKAQEILEDVLQNYGVTPVFYNLFGSQNYETDTENSDFDFYVAVEPTFDDFVHLRAATSTKIDYGFGEITLKDIREVFKQFKKGAFNALEVVNANKMTYINPKYEEEWAKLQEIKNEISVIAPATTVRSLIGATGHSTEGEISPKKAARVLQFVNQINSYCAEYNAHPEYVDWRNVMNSKVLFNNDFIMSIKEGLQSTEYLNILAKGQFDYIHNLGTSFIHNIGTKYNDETALKLDEILKDICRKKNW